MKAIKNGLKMSLYFMTCVLPLVILGLLVFFIAPHIHPTITLIIITFGFIGYLGFIIGYLDSTEDF